jgi:hypothetical protein
MVPLHKLLRKYSDRPRPNEMIDIRYLLEDLIPLDDDDFGYRIKLIEDIKSFGIRAYVKDTDNNLLTGEQWLILYKTMYKVFKDAEVSLYKLMEPGTADNEEFVGLYRVDKEKVSPEVTTLFVNLIETLSNKISISSEMTTHILDFFAVANIMVADGYYMSDLIENVRKVLGLHGWTDGGFNSAPNQKKIVEDLRVLFGHWRRATT